MSNVKLHLIVYFDLGEGSNYKNKVAILVYSLVEIF